VYIFSYRGWRLKVQFRISMPRMENSEAKQVVKTMTKGVRPRFFITNDDSVGRHITMHPV